MSSAGGDKVLQQNSILDNKKKLERFPPTSNRQAQRAGVAATIELSCLVRGLRWNTKCAKQSETKKAGGTENVTNIAIKNA